VSRSVFSHIFSLTPRRCGLLEDLILVANISFKKVNIGTPKIPAMLLADYYKNVNSPSDRILLK
jgi:hypothetical protein